MSDSRRDSRDKRDIAVRYETRRREVGALKAPKRKRTCRFSERRERRARYKEFARAREIPSAAATLRFAAERVRGPSSQPCLIVRFLAFFSEARAARAALADGMRARRVSASLALRDVWYGYTRARTRANTHFARA